jgi:hypothetical protein
MTQDNENTTPSEERETCLKEYYAGLRNKELFAAELRNLADLVEQDKIISATFYAHGDGVPSTSELYNATFPHFLHDDFCNCCEDDYYNFLDDVREEIMQYGRMLFGLEW